MEGKINILIAARHNDDRKRITESLSDQNDFFIAGAEKDESGVIIRSEQLKPDILIIDMDSIVINTTDIARMILRRSPSTAIIILSGKDAADEAAAAVKSGVSAFLHKNTDFNKLTNVIRIVYSGGSYVNDIILKKVFSGYAFFSQFPGQLISPPPNEFFTPIEHSVISGLAMGYSDEEIADDLHLGVGSVRNCIFCIKRKTKLKNRVEIVLFSLMLGLTRLEDFNIWNEKFNKIFNSEKDDK